MGKLIFGKEYQRHLNEGQIRISPWELFNNLDAVAVTKSTAIINGVVFKKNTSVFQEATKRSREGLSKWLSIHGQPNQIERFKVGLLPWHELGCLAKSVLFDSIKYSKNHIKDNLWFTCLCVDELNNLTPHPAERTVRIVEELEASEWDTWQDMKARLRADNIPNAKYNNTSGVLEDAEAQYELREYVYNLPCQRKVRLRYRTVLIVRRVCLSTFGVEFHLSPFEVKAPFRKAERDPNGLINFTRRANEP